LRSWRATAAISAAPVPGGRIAAAMSPVSPTAPSAVGVYGGGGGGYGTAVGESAPVAAAGGVHGFPAVLTSFIGRAGPVREVGVLLGQYRLVTVTGPGGAGKTRLAGEVARQAAPRFADGV
jgi:hypothetical protein